MKRRNFVGQTDDKLRALPHSAWLMAALAGPNRLSAPPQWRDAATQKLGVPLRDYLAPLGQTDPQMLRMMEIASNYNDFNETFALDILRRDTLRRAGLAFVGEHTVFDNSGMEAPLESGERAAEMILR